VQALEDYDLDHGNCDLLISPENDIILSTVHGYEIWRIGEDGEGVLQQTRLFEEICYTFFSPNMQLYCFRANPLKVFRVSDGSCHCVIHIKNLEDISTLAFSPDENSLAMCGSEGIVEMHALNRGDDEDSCIARWDTEEAADFYVLKFSTDSKYLSSAHDGRIKIWNVETKTCISCMEPSDPAADSITSVVEFCPFPNPAAVATSMSDTDEISIIIMEGEVAFQIGTLHADYDSTLCIDWSRNENLLLVGSDNCPSGGEDPAEYKVCYRITRLTLLEEY
jgi:WD40 repeat protein